jgi:RsiW-degrading membrane proteinase PrsW (M82 family)
MGICKNLFGEFPVQKILRNEYVLSSLLLHFLWNIPSGTFKTSGSFGIEWNISTPGLC